MTQTINALQLDGQLTLIGETDKACPQQEHAADYEKSLQQPIGLSSQHNYTEGQTYFYVSYGSRELGYYCRDPWRDGWITFSNYDGSREEVVTEDEAIEVITQSWRQAC